MTMSTIRPVIDRAHRALAHPVRAAILARLDERGEASPKELAAELEQTLETTSYHMRSLVRAGLVELARTSQRRGAVQHHYRTRSSETVAARLSLDARRATTFERDLRDLLARAAAAADGARASADGRTVELTVVVHRTDAQS